MTKLGESYLLDLTGLARLLVENMASVGRRMWRSVY